MTLEKETYTKEEVNEMMKKMLEKIITLFFDHEKKMMKDVFDIMRFALSENIEQTQNDLNSVIARKSF